MFIKTHTFGHISGTTALIGLKLFVRAGFLATGWCTHLRLNPKILDDVQMVYLICNIQFFNDVLQVRSDSAVRPLRGHEQNLQHQALPHRQGLPAGPALHLQGALQRVLPVCKCRLKSLKQKTLFYITVRALFL